MANEREVVFYDQGAATQRMLAEVLAGLRRPQKQIAPKYFYDEKGSQLFDAITELSEYYPTRIEMQLFDQHLPQVRHRFGDQSLCVVEYGSGSSKKIRRVLDTLAPSVYVPVDISRQYLLDNTHELHADFPHIAMYPVCADISREFELPAEVDSLHKLGFYPGSSIGNFLPTEAVAFLRRVRRTLGQDAHLLIGVDAKKPAQVLEAAYNDAAGVTAQFNLNVLRHLNDQLNTDFRLHNFQHEARYNQEQGCIQMFLRSTCDQQVMIGDDTIAFTKGERIHTEDSYKYSVQEFLQLAEAAGFADAGHWQDDQGWYSLFLLTGQVAQK
ncbi:MAG: L-histidine N(alpha)-methyltransferase [Pseudomonadota bacterium]|nr:L-histidine N(alpha)-methyltransferase [Pseudomonadota bacterium]